MSDVPGFVLLFLTFPMVLLFPRARANGKLLLAIWATLCFRHSLSLKNAFSGKILKTMYDPDTFFANALDPTLPQQSFYSDCLRVVFKAFGPSLFTGQELSVLAYVLTLYVFLELVHLLAADRYATPLVLLFGMLPSAAIHCSILLRESYQVLGFLTSIWLVYLMRDGARTWHAFMLLGCLFLLIEMHQGLALYAVLLAFFGLAWAVRGRSGALVVFLLFSASLMPLLLPTLLARLQEKSEIIHQISNNGLLRYTERYREGVEMARSDYGIALDVSSPIGLCVSVPAVVFMYQFAPLPWQVNSVRDYYAMFESLLRFLLMVGAVRLYQRGDPTYRQRALLMGFLALLLEGIWAAGTRNWGTATRHHLVCWGAYVLLGGPWLFTLSFDPEAKALRRRRERRLQQSQVPAPQESSEPPPSIGEAVRPLWANFWVFWLVLAVSLALLVFFNRKVFRWRQIPYLTRNFVSESTLFISPSSRAAYTSMFGTPGASPLDVWLSDPSTVNELLERQGTYRKALELYKDRPPDYNAGLLQEDVLISTFDKKSTLSARDALLRTLEGTEQDEDESTGRKQVRRVQLVRILAYAPTSLQAQHLNEAMLKSLQLTIANLAGEKAERSREMVSALVQKAERNVAHLQDRLARSSGTVEQEVSNSRELAEVKSSLNRLQAEIKRTEETRKAVQDFVDHKGPPPAELSGRAPRLEQALEDLERQQSVAERLYMPQSFALEQVRNKRDDLAKAELKELERQARGMLEELDLQVRGRQAVVSVLEMERKDLAEAIPLAKQLAERAVVERQLDTWDSQLLNWRIQLFQNRIEERLGQADGSSLVLLPAQLGERPSVDPIKFFQNYAGQLMLVPVCFFVALLATGAVAELRGGMRVKGRVESTLGVKVVTVLPSLGKERSRAWTRWKNQGFRGDSEKTTP